MPQLKFVSTRGAAPPVTLSEAIAKGLAPDGGLYVPTRLPRVDVAAFAGVSGLPHVARGALDGFFAGDRLRPVLGQIADAALDLPAPTTAVAGCPDPLFALELSMDRPRRSRISARVSWPRASKGCRRRIRSP